jgi:hypothetical protein
LKYWIVKQGHENETPGDNNVPVKIKNFKRSFHEKNFCALKIGKLCEKAIKKPDPLFVENLVYSLILFFLVI